MPPAILRSSALAAVALFASSAIVPGTSQLPTWLHSYIRTTDADLERLERGEVVSRVVPSPDGRELTVVGAVRLRCSLDSFSARVRDIVRFKASDLVLEIGRFGASPSARDLAGLHLDSSDVAAIRDCRPGSCAFRLPSAVMDQFRRQGEGPAPLTTEAAEETIREFLASEARAYLAGGSQALADYADHAAPLNRAEAFNFLIRPSEFGSEYQPELFEWLRRFPAGRLDGVDSFLYWSREKFGLKPVISLTHSAIYRRRDAVYFASKQIYASRYFDSSLGASVMVARAGDSCAYLTYMSRSRLDMFRGFLGGIARAIGSRKMRDGIKGRLVEAKGKLESGR